MTGIELWLASGFASYLYSKFLDLSYNKLFKDKKDFVKSLRIVIDNSIDEFAIEYPIEEKDDKFPFYKSQAFVDILMKYRLYEENGFTDYQEIKSNLAENIEILEPTEEQIRQFLTLFENEMMKDDKLKDLFCRENSDEKIFEIAAGFKKQFDLLMNMDKKLDVLLARKISENTSGKYLNNVPTQDNFVVGRNNDLKQVAEKLDADKSLLLMNGLGGHWENYLGPKVFSRFH